ncbi:MAG: response regulator transcription factor [Flavobacteriales bacterium]|nr:response regulator transcription factor [Flavobacteriales bacterium]
MIAINILHSNKHSLAHAGLISILKNVDGIETIYSVKNEKEIVSRLSFNKYEIAILDYDRVDAITIEIIHDINRVSPFSKILIISSTQNVSMIKQVIKMNVYGFISNTCGDEELVTAVRTIQGGEKHYSKEIIDLLEKHRKGREKEKTALSEREIQITALVAKGFSNKEIADKLYLSVHTIGTHRKNILKKLGFSSICHLVLYALHTGIINSEDYFVHGEPK